VLVRKQSAFFDKLGVKALLAALDGILIFGMPFVLVSESLKETIWAPGLFIVGLGYLRIRAFLDAGDLTNARVLPILEYLASEEQQAESKELA
jgi:hypothetical protein